jgi:hypothetical protein
MRETWSHADCTLTLPPTLDNVGAKPKKKVATPSICNNGACYELFYLHLKINKRYYKISILFP